MKTSLIAFFTVLLSYSVVAQTAEKDTLMFHYPADVIITAPRMSMSLMEIPFSTSLVTSDVITSLSRSIAIDEPMKLVPGIKIDNQANGSRIHLSIRGQGILSERGIRGIKILLDEIPINDPTGFAPDVFDVDYGTLDRIEALRGPAAALYGGGASGGILNIVTQNGGNKPFFAEAFGTFGSNNFSKKLGQFGGNVQNVNYRVSFSRASGDGFRNHTHFWGNNVYGKATYTPSDRIALTPIFSWSDFYHENPEGVTLDQYMQNIKMANPDAIPYNEFLETNRTTFGLTGFFKLSETDNVQFNGYVKRTLFTEANNRTFNHRTIVTPGTSVQITHRSGADDDFIRNNISAGIDLQWQTIDEHRTDNLHSVEGDTVRSKERIAQSGVGFCLIDKLNLGSKWGLMGCIRYDDIHNELTDQLKGPYDLSGNADFSKTTVRVGVAYSASQDVSFFSNWGQGFLPPATEELAQNPDQFGGFNSHLTYATSQGIEIGSRGVIANFLQYEITGFSMTTENDFDRYRITNPLRNQETFYRNAGSSRRYGLELYTKYSPVRSLTIQLAYTFSDFKFTNRQSTRILMDDTSIVKYAVDGNFLPNSPQHQLYLDASFVLLPGLVVGLSCETVSKTYIDGANIESEAANGYALLHAQIRYGLNFAGIQGELAVHFKNLADKEYIAFTEPDPGGNAYQAGSRREVFGSLRFRF
jgi:iron complex outermembrane receptor protein